jgi:dTDP-glucose pyrophosphorylase
MRRPCTFRQRDATALIRAAVAAGYEVARVEMDRDGKIVLIMEKPDEPPGEGGGEGNEWDEA